MSQHGFSSVAGSRRLSHEPDMKAAAIMPQPKGE
jgi:hypothetical protein